MSFQSHKFSFAGIAFVLALLLLASPVAVRQTSAHTTQAAASRSAGPAHFTWIAPTGLTRGSLTIIDNLFTNNTPNAILFVTPNFNPGAIGGTYDPHPVGVVYNTFLGEWEIFNEDGANMPLNAAFNVLVFPKAGGSVFVQTATSANIIGDFTSINNALTNGQPAAQLLITQSFNPFFAPSGTTNSHPVGVWYDTAIRQWAVFNEDRTGMPLNASFNILVGTGASGGTEFLQTTTTANQSGDVTIINNGAVNGRPNAIILVTPNWNPGGSGGTYDPHPVGVADLAVSGQWLVLNEDKINMPLNAAFNVLAF